MVNKRSLAAKKRVKDKPKGYMSSLAKKLHTKKTPEERSVYGKMMAEAKKKKL
jgi:hypothetical protein